jgi:catechol 2,3-dioxygenase-like lactoylglutathione lyase family enzyme
MKGINHITYLSKNLDLAASFFCDGLGAVEVYDSNGKNFSISREKFFLLGELWIAVMEGAPAPRSYHHVAFSVDDAQLEATEARLRKIGVEVRPPRPRVSGEGRSLYFYDFDDNLFELHTGSLNERLELYHLLSSGSGQ